MTVWASACCISDSSATNIDNDRSMVVAEAGFLASVSGVQKHRAIEFWWDRFAVVVSFAVVVDGRGRRCGLNSSLKLGCGRQEATRGGSALLREVQARR